MKNYQSFISERVSERRDIVVTLPATIEWSDYEKELDAVRDRSQTMNFKVPTLPKVGPGSKCYVVHRGVLRGWMEITGTSEKEFTCTTTGKRMSGKFVERSGPFHFIEEEVPMKGFQGYRYYEESKK